MKKLKWLVIGVAVLLVFTYGMYALSYQGHYNVKVTVPVELAGINAGGAWVQYSPGVKAESTPTGIFDFWTSLSVAGSSSTYSFEIYCELASSRGTTTEHQSIDTTSVQYKTFIFEFNNVSPGEATAHIYILLSGFKVFDSTYPVVIG